MSSQPRSLLVLGTSTKLATYELSRVLKRHGVDHTISLFKDSTFSVSEKIDASILSTLGGAVKAATIIANNAQKDDLPSHIVQSLNKENSSHKIALSSTSLQKNVLSKIAIRTKDASEERISFRILKSITESAGLQKKYQEYIIEKLSQDTYLVAKTYWVQDIEHWSFKDYKRPYADPKSGMLPPKVARMMLNIALPLKIEKSTTVFDPMCGTGTVLMEAVDLGIDSVGSDIRTKCTNESLTNARWLKNRLHSSAKVETFEMDITQLKPDSIEPIDAIVFEGYLGPASLAGKNIKNIHKGFEKLYTGALKRLVPLVKKGGRIVAALPEIQLEDSVKNLDSLIDRCEKYGYTSLSKFTYGRPTAKIRRNIYILEKN